MPTMIISLYKSVFMTHYNMNSPISWSNYKNPKGNNLMRLTVNFQKIDGSKVTFMNGETAEFDDIILCTGYKIDLPFLSQPIRDKVLDSEKNSIKVSMSGQHLKSHNIYSTAL